MTKRVKLPIIRSFRPKKGTFWEQDIAQGSHTTIYVHEEGNPDLCIGQITRAARRRYRWARYDKPVRTDTTRRTRPKFAESQTVPRVSSALWALKTSHANASRG